MKKKLLLAILLFGALQLSAQLLPDPYINSGDVYPFFSSFDLAGLNSLGGTAGTWETNRAAVPGFYSSGVLTDNTGTHSGYFINASDAHNVNGYVKKNGTGSFTFPVGTGTVLRSLSISSPASTNSAIAVAWIAGDPANAAYDPTLPNPGYHSRNTSKLGSNILAVSPVGEWDWMDITNNGSGLIVTVSIPDMTTFTLAKDLRLVGWDGGSWQDLSGGPSATGNTAGSLLSGIMRYEITAIGIGSAASLLDIKLADFSITEQNCNAQVNFTTTAEDPNTTIDIEQSPNGLNFTRISSVVSQYPNGGAYHINAVQNDATAFYRLKIINADGRYRYSAVKTLTTTCSSNNHMSFYPNPISGAMQASLRFNTDYRGKARLLVYNTTGQQLLNQPATIVSGQNIIPVNTSSLSAGVYYMQLVGENGKQINSTQKLIKQ